MSSPSSSATAAADPARKPKKAAWNKGRAFREARALVHQHRRRLGLGLGLLVFGRLAGLALPASTKFLVDDVLGERREELLWPLAGTVFLAALVQGVSSRALAEILGVAAQDAINDLRRRVHEHVLHLPTSWFDRNTSGAVISRVMSDAEGVRNLVGNGIVQLVGSTMTALLALGVLFWLDWRLTLIVLAALVVFGGFLAHLFRKLRPIFRERRALNAEVSGRLGEAVGGIRVVKGFTGEGEEARVFAGGIERLFHKVRQTIQGVATASAVATVTIGALAAITMVYGGQAILDGRQSLGEFVMFLAFAGLLATPVVQISSIGTQISEAFAGLDRIREVLDVAREDDAARRTAPEILGQVRFEDVHFRYDEAVPVLQGVSFEAQAGETIALVGSSGSGKSTLVALVSAFIDPDAGRILIDGTELSSLERTSYRRALGVVLQDDFLFDGTIADNIAYSRPGATRAEVIAAAERAHCHTFVSGFPDGYESVVGERGVKLSGGQRQRLAIARALLADPRILILDEATSSLDGESEGKVQAALSELRAGRTTFVIAHRLSTIRSADCILVLEDGRIVERGRHAELMAAGGRYRELHDLQSHAEEERFRNPGEEWKPSGDRT